MNVKLLRKVQKHILEEPKRFFMEGTFYHATPGRKVVLDDIERVMPACGTAACIAGWACLLSGERVTSMFLAKALLGIEENEALLFIDGNWPQEFYHRWINTRSLKERAQIAAARIDHFIKTKGKE